jgi:hypothetical protein
MFLDRISMKRDLFSLKKEKGGQAYNQKSRHDLS